MTTKETIAELDKILIQLKRIRRGNAGTSWFCSVIKSAEALVKGAKKAVEHVTKATS